MLEKIIEKIIKCLRSDNRGTIKCKHGKNQIFIKTPFTPRKVWLNIKPSYHNPTCDHLEHDLFTAIPYYRGFIFIFDIKSNEKTINWYIE